MKINYAAIQDVYTAQPNPLTKGVGKYFCPVCKKTVDERQFFKTSRIDKFPSGYLPHCKTCTTMLVVDTDPSTFLGILKEIDIPYIPSEWRTLLVKKDAKAPSILGKYASKMKLNQFKKYGWKDTEKLAADEEASLLAALRQECDTESEAEAKLESMISMTDLPQIKTSSGQISQPTVIYGLVPETSKYHLTQQEINELKISWGEDYTEDQYLALEQFFVDMKQAYVIQDPIIISNVKIICKLTVIMNKFLDIGDVESAAKISRQLDLFIKTANLAPVQQKDRQQTTFAISQLSFLVEKEGGFIPEFFISEPNDKIDLVLQDMKEYTEYLIRGESNISEMISNTEAILAQEKLPDAVEDMDDFMALEKELLNEIEEIEENAATDQTE
jgi:hypothetical protein